MYSLKILHRIVPCHYSSLGYRSQISTSSIVQAALPDDHGIPLPVWQLAPSTQQVREQGRSLWVLGVQSSGVLVNLDLTHYDYKSLCLSDRLVILFCLLYTHNFHKWHVEKLILIGVMYIFRKNATVTQYLLNNKLFPDLWFTVLQNQFQNALCNLSYSKADMNSVNS